MQNPRRPVENLTDTVASELRRHGPLSAPFCQGIMNSLGNSSERFSWTTNKRGSMQRSRCSGNERARNIILDEKRWKTEMTLMLTDVRQLQR